MARGTRPDLLPQCLPRAFQLCPQNRDGEGAAGLAAEYGDAVQRTRGLAADLEEE